MHRELFGSEHPGSISIMAHLVLAYFEAGNFSRAKNQLHEAVDMIQQVPDSLLAVDSIESLEILADLSCRFQEFRVAGELYRREATSFPRYASRRWKTLFPLWSPSGLDSQMDGH